MLYELFSWILLGPLITGVCTCVMAHDTSCPRADANDLEITKIQFISPFSLHISKGLVLFAEFIAVVKYKWHSHPKKSRLGREKVLCFTNLRLGTPARRQVTLEKIACTAGKVGVLYKERLD